MNSRQSAATRVGPSTSFSNAARATSLRGQLIANVTGTSPPQHASVLPIDLISENPGNPRETLGDLSGLASSLAEVGQVQAITVASAAAYLEGRPGRQGELKAGAEYVVVDGHRRLAAALEAGFTDIKVTFDDGFAATDEALLEAAFVANAQKESLSDLEYATALKKLVDFYGSQGKAAKRLGLSQPNISQKLSLLALTPALQADLESGKRKIEHVRGLARLSPEEQQEAADRRAREADERKQQKKGRRSQDPAPHNAVMGQRSKVAADVPSGTGAGTESGPTDSASTHNGVMTRADAPTESGAVSQADASAHNGVMTQADGSIDHGVSTPAGAPTHNGVMTPAVDADADADTERPPHANGEAAPDPAAWESVEKLAECIIDRLEQEDVLALTLLLQHHNRTVLRS
ncbi:ParB/RepB/Spo0J family partition protein [Streptomyces sp. NPDC006692]|uniref:ParB/RepB/Spo0J family partition protein n=1 Tax=Streptomyces sp. NPDC006692 TaxID=3364758 RepID=UPI0036C47A10